MENYIQYDLERTQDGVKKLLETFKYNGINCAVLEGRTDDGRKRFIKVITQFDWGIKYYGTNKQDTIDVMILRLRLIEKMTIKGISTSPSLIKL